MTAWWMQLAHKFVVLFHFPHISDYLNFWNFSSCWVPKVLSEDYKTMTRCHCSHLSNLIHWARWWILELYCHRYAMCILYLRIKAKHRVSIELRKHIIKIKNAHIKAFKFNQSDYVHSVLGDKQGDFLSTSWIKA